MSISNIKRLLTNNLTKLLKPHALTI
ncbi:MAG: hypothetical protein QOH07_57, partial [Mycobacterium sp.]|nr:hypothetical protein [Mycobacterium sp.]